MTRHKHAELMALYAQDALETNRPELRWQLRWPGREWTDMERAPSWSTGYEYRRKPRTININGYEVPEPVREALSLGADYFNPQLSYEKGSHDYRLWNGTQEDFYRLQHGLVHLAREAAEMHRKALLSFTEVQE